MSLNPHSINKDIYLLETELTGVAMNDHKDNRSWFYGFIPVMNTLLVVSAIGILIQMFVVYMS